jgi:hypothetical protein
MERQVPTPAAHRPGVPAVIAAALMAAQVEQEAREPTLAERRELAPAVAEAAAVGEPVLPAAMEMNGPRLMPVRAAAAVAAA